MTREEVDVLWAKAVNQAVEAGEVYTRYHFAALVEDRVRSEGGFKEGAQAAYKTITDLINKRVGQ